jgi:tRNA 2-thiocytidine biosynthesis protein TtcA
LTEKNLSKLVGQAVNDYDMIRSDDRILVGISGGADSIALLLLLHNRLKRIPIKYHLYPVLVDNFNGDNTERNRDVDALTAFIFKETGLTLEVIREPIVKKLLESPKPARDVCFLCAQKRRHILIQKAFSLGCTRIAFGHHKDDIVVTSLMNLFYKRELSSMLPRLSLFAGKMEIIRPMAYVQKFQIESYIFNYPVNVPILSDACPAKFVRKDHRRQAVKEIAERLASEVPNFKNNLFASYRNPKTDYLLDNLYQPKTSGRFKRP